MGIDTKNDVKFIAPKRQKDGSYKLPPNPDKAKAVAYTTKAVSDFIADLQENGDTIEDVYNKICKTLCIEGQAILKRYIDLGLGKTKARFGYGGYLTVPYVDEFGHLQARFKYPYPTA